MQGYTLFLGKREMDLETGAGEDGGKFVGHTTEGDHSRDTRVFELHQQVNVAVWSLISREERTEKRQPTDEVLPAIVPDGK